MKFDTDDSARSARTASPGARALGYMALSASLFALMNFFARLASSSASWMSVAGARALIGALVGLAVARIRGVSVAVNDRRAMLWRSIFGTAAMAVTFYALSSRTLPLGDTVTLLNLTPVFLAVLAPFVLRERTSGAVAFAILFSLGGVGLILHPTFTWRDAGTAPGPTAAMTAAAAVLAAFLASFGMMLLRKIGPTETAEAVAVHFSLFAAAAMLLLSLLDLRMPVARDLGYMVLAGVCGGLGQIVLTRAYTLESAARVSGMGYLAVIASALLGAAVLGERPTPGAIVGMGLVVLGGLVVTFTGDKMK